MKLFKRGGIAALSIVGAAFIAAGCGGSSNDPAKNAEALDLIPKNAVGYIAIDTDIDSKAWTNFEKIYPAFNAGFKGLDSWIDMLLKDADGDVDYDADVKPWLGDSAGLAVTSAEFTSTPKLLAWVELKDSAEFETFAKAQGFKKGATVGDFQTWSQDDAFVGVSDDLALLAQSKKELAAAINFDGDSIKDAPGVSDAIDEVGKNALATVVFGGPGVRAALKDAGQLSAASDLQQLKALQAGAMSFSAQKDGLTVDGYVVSDGEDMAKNEKNKVFEDLPANTVLAFGGNDLGGGLGGAVDDAGKENAQVQQSLGLVTGVLGVSVDDLVKAFDGAFALGISADDEGLGALAGGAAGAAMGGGLGDLDLGGILKAGSVTLAFEETGNANETLDKLLTGIGGLTGSTTAPKSVDLGDFETKTLAVQGVPVTIGASDDVAVVSLGLDVFDAWGDETLSDNDSFNDAWKAADAPDKNLGMMFADYPRVAALAGYKSADGAEAGGWVGWVESDKSNASFGVFMHVPES